VVFVSTVLLVLLVLAPSSRRSAAVLETPQQVNDRIRSMSAAARVMPHDYVIGNGDLLDLEVFDVRAQPSYVRVSRPAPSASPRTGSLHVAGLRKSRPNKKFPKSWNPTAWFPMPK